MTPSTPTLDMSPISHWHAHGRVLFTSFRHLPYTFTIKIMF